MDIVKSIFRTQEELLEFARAHETRSLMTGNYTYLTVVDHMKKTTASRFFSDRLLVRDFCHELPITEEGIKMEILKRMVGEYDEASGEYRDPRRMQAVINTLRWLIGLEPVPLSQIFDELLPGIQKPVGPDPWWLEDARW